eukprot:3681799-Rhodomonas_salina.2
MNDPNVRDLYGPLHVFQCYVHMRTVALMPVGICWCSYRLAQCGIDASTDVRIWWYYLSSRPLG